MGTPDSPAIAVCALVHENAVLTRELGAVQQRCSREAADQARRIQAQQGEILRLRAAVIGRDTLLAALREDLQLLEAAVLGLRSRAEPAPARERPPASLARLAAAHR